MTLPKPRRGRRTDRASVLARVHVLGLLLAAVALPASAAAGATAIRTGYYAGLIRVPSVEVTFHVRAHDAVPDLIVICLDPTKPSWLTGTPAGGIFVHMPKGTVHGGKISYDGRARVTPGFAGAKTVATSRLHLNLHHVSGPVLRYTFEGVKHTETRAWVGTVSTAACKSLPAHGRAKLYGPVAGE